jgi:hypothetical protein
MLKKIVFTFSLIIFLLPLSSLAVDQQCSTDYDCTSSADGKCSDVRTVTTPEGSKITKTYCVYAIPTPNTLPTEGKCLSDSECTSGTNGKCSDVKTVLTPGVGLGYATATYCVYTTSGLSPTITPDSTSKVKTVSEIQALMGQPTAKINIPGLNFSETKVVDEAGQTYIYVPFIGEYLSAIYKWLIVALGIFTVVRFLQAGFGWIMAGGEAEKINNEKKKMQNAVTGMLLAVCSYILLYTINPNLVEFKSLRVQYIKTVPLSEEYLAAESVGKNLLSGASLAIPQLVNGEYSGLKVPSASSCGNPCIKSGRCADQSIRDMAYEAQKKTGYPAAVMVSQYLTEGPTFGSTCSGGFIPSEKASLNQTQAQSAIDSLNCFQYGNCSAGFTWECTNKDKYKPPKASMDFNSDRSTKDCGKGDKAGKGFTQVHGYRCFANPNPGNIFALLIKTYERIPCIKNGREKYGGDPVTFAKLVQSCGYATAQNYAQSLIDKMNKYCLIGNKDTSIVTTDNLDPIKTE